jgi:hypothetical protein
VVLVGGGAANPGLVRAFREQLCPPEDGLLVPHDAAFLGAQGAASMSERAPATSLRRFLDVLKARSSTSASVHSRPAQATLPRLLAVSEDLEIQATEDPSPVDGAIEAYLGSTSAL